MAKFEHCFLGANGGVSKGKYAALNTNLKSLDLKENVWRNLEIVANKINGNINQMFLPVQGTTSVCVYAEEPSLYQIKADGVVTNKKGILIGIKTADCAPILLADKKHHVIGAAHCGWRGTYKGVLENVVDLMLQKGAQKEDICAAIGPCLQKDSFAVQSDMKDVFLQYCPQSEKYFFAAQDDKHFYFDLSACLVEKLHNLGIYNVENCGIDTYPAQNGYFSYRRSLHGNLMDAEFDYPTQYSVIKL